MHPSPHLYPLIAPPCEADAMKALSLKYRIAITIFLLGAIVLAVVVGTTLTAYLHQSRAQLDREEKAVLDLLSHFAKEALLTQRYELIQPNLESIADQVHVLRIQIYDAKQHLVAKNNVAISADSPANQTDARNTYWKARELGTPSNPYGRLAIQFSDRPLLAFHADIRNQAIFLSMLGLFTISVLAIFASHILTRRLGTLKESADRVALGQFDIQTNIGGSDELTALGQAFDRMALAIAANQRQLQEQSRHIQLLLDSTAEAIYGIDNNGICTFVNHACVAVLGYQSATELIGRKMHELAHHSHANFEPYLQYESPINRVTHSGEQVYTDSEVMWRKDGSKFPAEYWSYPIIQDEKLTGAVVTFFDITKRKKYEQALIESEQRWRSITENSPDHIMELDLKGNIKFINYTVAEFTNEQVIDTPAFMYVPKEYVQAMKDAMQNVLVTHQIQNYESAYRDPTGHTEYYESRIGPLSEGEQITGFTLSARNVTVRKEIELALKKQQDKLEELVEERTSELQLLNNELEAFSYSVSHDLRAPLRSIDGFTRLLIDESDKILDQSSKDHLQRILNSCQRMGVLIDDLLELSKVSRHEIQRDIVNLSTLVRDIVDQLQEAQPDTHVQINIQDALTAIADVRLMQILLDNLLSNAWKYTSKMATPQISFGLKEVNGTHAFYVADNGIGFDMRYSANLFKPFKRMHSNDDYPGTGIGLATVERIIQRHNGKVWAQSEPGKGTTFYFILNSKPQPHNTKEPSRAKQTNELEPLS